MQLTPDICYRALRTRDARFDGRFFVAVRSTGVYCRPICPASTPKRENCVFVPCAAAAQEAGYRPCLRCRPEASPGTPAWLGTSATVSRGLRLIGEGVLDHGSVADLAERLGVGERHLRRLFLQHLGAAPLAVAQNRRLLFAKKLLDETGLPMAEVAFASGFASVRRFNAAVRAGYGRTPRELRRARRGSSRDRSETVLKLPFRRPFDWQGLLDFLALRAIPGVEVVSEGRYTRSVEIGAARGTIRVEGPSERQDCLVASIRLDASAPLIEVAERLRRVFDLGADPGEIARHLRSDPELARRLDASPGVRVPGAWDGFELAVRAILGQQVSVRGATTLAGRLASRYGEALSQPDAPGVSHLFPTPAILGRARLAGLGLPGARARAISGLARAVDAGRLRLDASRGLEDTVRTLCELPGIGEWTAQYVAMRALREPDAFPAGDLGLRRALRSGNGAGPMAEKALALRAEAWRPWRAYAAVLLWTAPERA
ncbi:MAG: DNA-3-methyladenine glycosylase 2 family protein [Deltaproteobacteria bacterium]|nr:DNA-3-methyladenine glycosylase 2 family protein [Deltaproteobacteria bacterium]